MNLINRLWRSSLGKKYIMAVTGAVLSLFVVGHLAGNLQVFGAPELINTHAHFLKSKPGLLWGTRLGLLACVGLHIAAAITLTRLNKEARPQVSGCDSGYGSTIASRTMLISGMVIAAFAVYHIAHFTVMLEAVNGVGDFGKLTTQLHGERVPDVYAMMVLGFQVWWVVLFYLVAQALLFLHLGHGLSAMFQSLGLRNHVWWPRIEAFAKVTSLAIFIGYAMMPVAIYLRIVGADYAETKRHELKDTAVPSVTAAAAGTALAK